MMMRPLVGVGLHHEKVVGVEKAGGGDDVDGGVGHRKN
jgi:hypothetical protein